MRRKSYPKKSRLDIIYSSGKRRTWVISEHDDHHDLQGDQKREMGNGQCRGHVGNGIPGHIPDRKFCETNGLGINKMQLKLS